MTKEQLLENLSIVEKKASMSKFRRMLVNPIKYIFAILHREFFYKSNKNDRKVISATFFDNNMHLLLPTSTDIYLTGGKSHDSEIRLAKFLIKNLNSTDTFVDVGAHYGYFTLLGSKLVGSNGSVHSFEASPSTYKVICQNTTSVKNTQTYNLAISDQEKELTFYEFPNLYSEYNTFNIDQFKDSDWVVDYPPTPVTISCIQLDTFFSSKKINPTIIKIDVEGAEYQVIKGMEQFLSDHSPIIVMEFLSEKRGNIEHQLAEKLLHSLNFAAFAIQKNGSLISVESATLYLKMHQIESDNIVFKKV